MKDRLRYKNVRNSSLFDKGTVSSPPKPTRTSRRLTVSVFHFLNTNLGSKFVVPGIKVEIYLVKYFQDRSPRMAPRDVYLSTQIWTSSLDPGFRFRNLRKKDFAGFLSTHAADSSRRYTLKLLRLKLVCNSERDQFIEVVLHGETLVFHHCDRCEPLQK